MTGVKRYLRVPGKPPPSITRREPVSPWQPPGNTHHRNEHQNQKKSASNIHDYKFLIINMNATLFGLRFVSRQKIKFSLLCLKFIN